MDWNTNALVQTGALNGAQMYSIGGSATSGGDLSGSATGGYVSPSPTFFYYDYWYPYYQSVRVEHPRECVGDLHVFPCPHCDSCKCGGAVKAKQDGKKKRPKY